MQTCSFFHNFLFYFHLAYLQSSIFFLERLSTTSPKVKVTKAKKKGLRWYSRKNPKILFFCNQSFSFFCIYHSYTKNKIIEGYLRRLCKPEAFFPKKSFLQLGYILSPNRPKMALKWFANYLKINQCWRTRIFRNYLCIFCIFNEVISKKCHIADKKFWENQCFGPNWPIVQM